MVDRVVVPAEASLTNTPADNTNNAPKGDIPEGFPAKFIVDGKPDYGKLTKSYTELESKFGGKPAPDKAFDDPDPVDPADAEKPKDGDPPDGDKEVSLDEAKSYLPGFSTEQIQEISDYAWENGELTDEHYASLAKEGYSKEIVDQFMEGRFAVQQGAQDAIINAGGGQERVQQMFAWAAENLTPQQQEAYNAKFAVGGADAIMAMEHLSSKYTESGVALPTGGRVSGANAPRGADGSVFNSTAQVTEAMSDPRYKTDPAYRKSVEDKLGRSKVL